MNWIIYFAGVVSGGVIVVAFLLLLALGSPPEPNWKDEE